MKEVNKSTSSDPITTVGEVRDWVGDGVVPDKATFSATSGTYEGETILGAQWKTMEYIGDVDD